ncbi:hypothetical protein SAMD00019534_066360 [Acytostelium subglobosum LB1]|uniref:hypothetical protein n=1 Tax=Acytostelium subglobosum LB1 TaxID=1410327 RepID=UPI0006448D41|nr:hypothetical protein SAMD00019534_066360 [Acytostelium subglobosum LB1]GAM23461.1 hypothetical protein SAMD00019534_066360 [Acytostelium subglobosum LB1]|eukprot:XP_012753910.1 hypothetical protein SAMD00019534_066360 [Acytostelium subglobosum LB1]
MAKNAAAHLGRLIQEQQLLTTQGVLRNELKESSKAQFRENAVQKVDNVKKMIKNINEGDSVLPNKLVVKQNHETKKWFNFGAGEITDEMKTEANMIKLKKFADNTQKYTRSAKAPLPKYFEIGTIVNNHEDYHNRFTNKEKKRGNLGDLMADDKVMAYIDKKSSELISEARDRKKQRTAYHLKKKSNTKKD